MPKQPHADPLSSVIVGRDPCPECGSSDANVVYEDGHEKCFSMGCKHFVSPTDSAPTTRRSVSTTEKTFDPIEGEAEALPARKLHLDTCEKWRYEIGKDKYGNPVQIANYFKDGQRVGQKIRGKDKKFSVIGKISGSLFGQHLWRDGGKMLVITEGEIDALSVSQAQGNKWPVVSIPNGVQGAKKALQANIEWLEGYESVILMFDNDEPGKAAVEECVALFSPGKVKVASLPLKDANEMLKAGRERELISAIWDAKVYRPDGIVSVDDVIEKALKAVEWGISWCLPTLDDATFGRRFGEIYAVGAGTGIGKTDFLSQQVAWDIVLGFHPCVFFLEQNPEETLARVAGKTYGEAFHVPGAGWTEQKRIDAFNALRGKLTFYDSFGANDWDIIKAKIRYLAVAEGRSIFYLDHLTALADTANERESLEQLMKEMASLAMELQIMITFVSHLSTPEGRSHEEGGRVMIKHFKGSRSIGMWSHFMFGLERDTQADDPKVRSKTTFRVLKDRKTGRGTGVTFFIRYDPDTTQLEEVDEDEFEDESSGGHPGSKDF